MTPLNPLDPHAGDDRSYTVQFDDAPGLAPTGARGISTAPAEGPGPRLLTASTLKGNKIVNLQDETLGHVEEIMLDVQRGRVAYAVMASGGFLGIGERLFAIPWAVLTLDPDRQCFVMDAGSDYFENAPGFDKNHWPLEAQRDWHDEIHRHYRIRPYWD